MLKRVGTIIFDYLTYLSISLIEVKKLWHVLRDTNSFLEALDYWEWDYIIVIILLIILLSEIYFFGKVLSAKFSLSQTLQNPFSFTAIMLSNTSIPPNLLYSR
jgi:hypothetical protein